MDAVRRGRPGRASAPRRAGALGTLTLVAAVTLAQGCLLGESPEEQARHALPPDPSEDEGATHRPGQSCLLCHGDRAHHGPLEEHEDPELFLAGTVYERAGDSTGLGGVTVLVRDGDGREVVVTSNRTGNFMLRLGGHDDEGGGPADGVAALDSPLRMPLEVELSLGEVTRAMRTRVQRERSCNGCHTAEAGAASPGRIFVREAMR